MTTLRPYQQDGLQAIRQAFGAGHRRVLYVLPTGGGKTLLFTYIAKGIQTKGKRVLIVAHRRELLEQISGALRQWGVPHATLAGGSRGIPHTPVVVASVFTLVNRLKHWPAPDLIVGDEAHHFTVDSSWGTVVKAFPAARVLGVTATPERLDGKGLRDVFDHMIVGPSVAELTAQGYLSPAEVYAPARPNLAGIAKRGGDYVKSQLETAMDKPSITGDAIEHYLRLIPGRRAVAFCVSVQHAKDVADLFKRAGVASEHIDGSQDDAVRSTRIKQFRAGSIQVLTSCDLISEGFDLPAIEGAILLRPTESLGLYMQQVGRAIRPSPGKECIARGALVLTHRGLKPIEKVLLSDLLWDGNMWVRHGGAICKGVRRVILYQGLEATEDHQVWTGQGWRSFGECAAQQIPIAQTGVGGRPVRLGNDSLPPVDVARAEVEQKDICLHALQHMRRREVGVSQQFTARSHERMPTLQPAEAIPSLALRPDAECAAALPEPSDAELPGLWRQRNHFRLYITSSSGAVGAGKSWHAREPALGRNRPSGQRQGICAGQSPVVDASAERIAYAPAPTARTRPPVSARLSGNQICRPDAQKNDRLGHDRPADHRSVPPPIAKAEREVWDILGAGPRSAFTVEGLLVHNCTVILDHAGNTLRHGFIDEPRDWTLAEGAVKKAKSGEATVAIKMCPTCYAVHRPAPTCPRCGHVYRTGRVVEQRAGTLEQISSVEEQAVAPGADLRRSYHQLVAVGRKRAYPDPQRWAFTVLESQAAKRLAQQRDVPRQSLINGLTAAERQDLWNQTIRQDASQEKKYVPFGIDGGT